MPSILLVEDDALIRANTAEMLAESGLTVVEAASAEQALRRLAEGPLDVLVTDINLPGASGPELATRARALFPAIGVVFASGDAAPLQRGAFRNSVSLPKPYGMAALVAAVHEAWAAASGHEAEPGVAQNTAR